MNYVKIFFRMLLKQCIRCLDQRVLSTCPLALKNLPHNLKGKSKSSQDWLTRQLIDPYVRMAKYENYRSRSAFKLIEIDDKYKLLKPGHFVLECGAAPGGWTQVIVERVNSFPKDEKKKRGKVISFDLMPFSFVDGATILPKSNISNPHARSLIDEHLEGKKVDVVLSDMAPNATGQKAMDHELIIELSKLAFDIAQPYSKAGASFVCKIWEGRHRKSFENELLKCYEKVKIVKPPSSRSHSGEIFLLAQNFKGN